MTAEKIMDVIVRLLDCDGHAVDAISAYTQIKMEDAQRLLKHTKSECPDVWIRRPKQNWPKSWDHIEDLVVPFKRNLHGHPLAGILGKTVRKKTFMVLGWEKKNKLGILVRSPKTKIILVGLRG